jgi:hypothetical protein
LAEPSWAAERAIFYPFSATMRCFTNPRHEDSTMAWDVDLGAVGARGR